MSHRGDNCTLFDTTFSLYCQLGRMVMYENDVPFTSRYVDLPNGEQLEPWFARINPKMIIPSAQLQDGTIINDSRNIMKLMDKKCPSNQQAKVEKIMDIAYSCDLGWFSTVAMKKKIWLWKIMQESGVMEKTVNKTITKYAADNADLRETYLKKLEISEKDVSAKKNLDRQGPIQKCLDDLVKVLAERKQGEWVTGPVFTRADALIAIYVRWVMWQIGWDSSLLTLDSSLVAFYEEVKNRPSYVKTFDHDCVWVGHYWRNRLVPVQRAILGAVLGIIGGAAYYSGVFDKYFV